MSDVSRNDDVSLPKTEAQWRKVLTPEQFQVTRQKGTETTLFGEVLEGRQAGRLPLVCAAGSLCSSRTASSRRAAAGLVSPSLRMPGTSRPSTTPVTSCSGLKCSAASAARTWDTFSTTARRPPDSDTASTQSPLKLEEKVDAAQPTQGKARAESSVKALPSVDLLAAVLLGEIEHEIAKEFDALDRHGVVDRRAEAAHRPVPLQLLQPDGGTLPSGRIPPATYPRRGTERS